MELGDILNIADAAARLKLSDRTVNAMLVARQLPGFKIRGQWRLLLDHFERWLEMVGAGESPEIATAKIMSNLESKNVDSVRLKEESKQIVDLSKPALKPQAAPIKPLSERVTQADLHRFFLDALGPAVVNHSPIERKPIEIDLISPLPARLRVYMFNATRPPGGRTPGEHKVQLMVPGQRRGERGNFDHGDGRLVLLCGYAAEEEVFILWDAGLYPNFSWSRNVQVKVETLIEASAGRIARQERRLRPSDGTTATEILLAFPRLRLSEAIELRLNLTRNRLAGN